MPGDHDTEMAVISVREIIAKISLGLDQIKILEDSSSWINQIYSARSSWKVKLKWRRSGWRWWKPQAKTSTRGGGYASYDSPWFSKGCEALGKNNAKIWKFRGLVKYMTLKRQGNT